MEAEEGLQFHKKRSPVEVMGETPKEGTTKDVRKEGATKDVDHKEVAEATKEDLFYSTFCPKEDDMWLALEEEVSEIEKFLTNN